jgi:hypothetical protein
MNTNKNSTRFLKMTIKQSYFGVYIVSLDGKTNHAFIDRMLDSCNDSVLQKQQLSILMKTCASFLSCETTPNTTSMLYTVETNVEILDNDKLWFTSPETPLSVIIKEAVMFKYDAIA